MEKIRKILIELVTDEVQELLDDPAAAFTSDEGIAERVRGLRDAAEFLGLNWDELIKQQGSVFEIDRLHKLLQNHN